MKKLIFASSYLMDYVDTENIELLKFNYTMDRRFWTGTSSFSSARYGKDYCALDIAVAEKIPCPEINLNFSKTFEEITDQRSKELLDLCRNNNRRLGIYYSGGIDSTVALASLIKNWPAADYQNIEVFLNQVSVVENYYFFKEQILENNIPYTFIYGNVTNGLNLNNYVLTDGEPADKLWFVNIGLTYFKNHGKDCLKYKWKDRSNQLIGFVSLYVGDEYANLYWNKISEALEEFPHVQTVGDWFSWINYNYHTVGHIFSTKWALRTNKDKESWDNFQQYYQPWFITTDYQQWAWGTSKLEKNNFSSITEYKKEAKNYIFDVDRNSFYHQFKSKMGSNMAFSGPRDKYSADLLIFDDGSGVGPTHPDLNNIVRSYIK